MLDYNLEKAQGFEVLHSSGEWRVAAHVYDMDVNSLEALKSWGIHQTSEEAFLLLKGKAWLVTSKVKEETDYRIQALEENRMYLVELGEPHAIVLEQGSRVLIMENADMSQSVSIPMGEQVRETIKSCIRE